MNYLAPAEPGELGFLFSFHYFHSEDLGEYLDRHGYTASLFVDSGAFSAFSQGVEVRLTDYVRFVRENSRRITRFANLDVIGNPTETRKGWGSVPFRWFTSERTRTRSRHTQITGISSSVSEGWCPTCPGQVRRCAEGLPTPS